MLPDLENAITDRLFLIINKEGKIFENFVAPSTVYDEFWHHLEKITNVFRVFDFRGAPDLSVLKDPPGTAYPSRPELPLEFLTFEGVYTDMPLVNIRIMPMEGDLFLGIVNIVRFLPNIYWSSGTVILYLDQEERIRAFNQPLLDLLGDATAKEPRKLLGRPVSEILETTPEEVQTRYFRLIEDQPAPDWEPRVQAAGEDLKDLDWQHARGPVFSPEGCLWRNKIGEAEALFLPRLEKLDDADFRLCVKGEVVSGDAPLLAAGNSPTPVDTLYQAGETLHRDGYEFKKSGFHLGTKPTLPERGLCKWTFEKRGQGLFFSVNDKNILRYYDPQFTRMPVPLFRLILRAGSGVRLEAVSLFTAPTPAPLPGPEQEVVRFRHLPDRYFSITLFHNLTLSSAYREIRAFLLSDVTPLQARADRYERQYEDERKRGERLKVQLNAYYRREGLLVGSSSVLQEIRTQADTVAASNAPVLVYGPTGAGKEVLAEYIHQQSPRRKAPFVKVDCSTLPAGLIESELFGHEKGAFTGATGRRAGRFEQADGGTLFLDEVGNLSPEMQAKLQGVLQDMTITRVGGEKRISLDVRLIAASNISLEALVKQGLFRQDLLYRINAITLTLPPLKDRLQDIPELCRHFLTLLNASEARRIVDLTPDAYRKLLTYAWPGNVRELKNVISHAAAFCQGEYIDEKLIKLQPLMPEKAAGMAGRERRPSHAFGGMGREEWADLLRRHRGNVSGIVRELGTTRKTCYYHFARFNLDPSSFRVISRL